MSLPHGGSTAPTITSPLLAWPSLPKARSPLTPSTSTTFIDSTIPSIYSRQPLSSSRSLASSLTRSDSWDVDRKGKGKEVDSGLGDVYVQVSPEQDRKYGPPKQPLTPHQLSRIAQSFGIIVPSLPTPSTSASPVAGPSRFRAEPPQRQSPYLLTVIPPTCLLGTTGISQEEAETRTRKWKRGRLIPLQATLGGMLVAIAREFGLPSTAGLQVYMGNGNGLSSGSSAASISEEECSGPRVSAQTWSTLFGQHLQGISIPRGSSPSNTPIKSSGPLGRDVAYPLSPLSLVERKMEQSRREPRDKFGVDNPNPPLSAPTARAGSETRFLSTPSVTAMPTGPVIGTIEFDVDMDTALWFDEYKRAGRYRKSSTSSDSGIRPLRLAHSTASPVLANRSRTLMLRDSDGFRSGDTTLNEHDTSGDFSKDFPPIRSASISRRRLSVRGMDKEGMMSTAGSFGEFPSEGDEFFASTRNSSDRGWGVPEITLHERAESGGKVQMYEPINEELLASPIELGGETLSPISPRVDGDDKRGSAMVMSDQLDDLERIMRQLSPRDIRLTSPRTLTPRMAAKVATSKLQFPVDPSSRPSRATSSLARPPSHSASSSSSSLSSATPIPEIEKSTLTVNTYTPQSSVPSFDATTLSRAPLEAEYSDAGLPRPAWPAVPFAKLAGDSPGSPNSIHEYFRQATPDSPISTETLSRMRMSPPASVPDMAVIKAPRRPNRPPSPDLSDPSIPPIQRQYSLSPELLRSPGGPGSPGAPPTPDKGARTKPRSGSISLKGLKHMSSRNFGWKRGENEKPPALPLATRNDVQHGLPGERLDEAIGLFGSGDGDRDGVRVSPQASTFPGLGMGQPTEFGQNVETAQGISRTGSVPSKTKESGGFSRWNPFGSRRGNALTAIPGSPAEKEKDKNRSSPKSSKRNPSIDHKSIGPPISGSFQRQQQHNGHGQSASISSVRSGSISHSQSRPSLPGMSSSATTHTLASEPAEEPGSPNMRGYSSSHGHGHGNEMSPRSVKRKPVPLPLGQGGLKPSESIGSIADVTDKRVNRGTWMGIPIGEPVVVDIAAAAAAAAAVSPEKGMKKSGSVKSLGKKGKGEVPTPPRLRRRGTGESDEKPVVPQGRGVWMGVQVG